MYGESACKKPPSPVRRISFEVRWKAGVMLERWCFISFPDRTFLEAWALDGYACGALPGMIFLIFSVI